MWKNKIIIEPWVRERILNSKILDNYEKENFLRFVSYLTIEEKDEFLLMI